MLSDISQSEKGKYHMIHSYVESNEHTELTSKIQTDSQMESRTTAIGRGSLEGGGIEQKGKRTVGHGQQCGDCCGKECKGTKW